LFLLKAPSLDEYISCSFGRLNQSQYVCDALMAADCAVPRAAQDVKEWESEETVIEFLIVESMSLVDEDKPRRDALYARNHAEYREVWGCRVCVYVYVFVDSALCYVFYIYTMTLSQSVRGRGRVRRQRSVSG
jgi:hypothetical protein